MMRWRQDWQGSNRKYNLRRHIEMSYVDTCGVFYLKPSVLDDVRYTPLLMTTDPGR
jgi:hypothetical protein